MTFIRCLVWFLLWVATLGAATIYVKYSDGLVIDLKGWWPKHDD